MLTPWQKPVLICCINSSKKHAAVVTCVPRIKCATLADEQRRRVDWQHQGHRPQTTRPAQTTTTTTERYSLNKRMLVARSLAPLPKQDRVYFCFMVFSMTKIPIRRPDVKLAQTLADVIIKKIKSDFNNWWFALVEPLKGTHNRPTDFETYCTIGITSS